MFSLETFSLMDFTDLKMAIWDEIMSFLSKF